MSRREQTVITRLRIGHSRLTHSYLLSKDNPPECDVCHCHISVKHLLLDCVKFADIRRKYFSCSSMKEIFLDIDPRRVIDFIKEIDFYRRL